MTHDYSPRIDPRPPGSGAFFDYVLAATRAQMRFAQTRRARTQHRLAEGRQTSAEQRWEGEGGNTQCAPGSEP